jgi:hypothetical protein
VLTLRRPASPASSATRSTTRRSSDPPALASGRRLTHYGDGWAITVLSWRVDAAGEADLIEELACVDGYAKIPEASAAGAAAAAPGAGLGRDAGCVDGPRGRLPGERTFRSRPRRGAPLRCRRDIVARHPLAETMAGMRPTLWPGCLIGRANRRRSRRCTRSSWRRSSAPAPASIVPALALGRRRRCTGAARPRPPRSL